MLQRQDTFIHAVHFTSFQTSFLDTDEGVVLGVRVNQLSDRVEVVTAVASPDSDDVFAAARTLRFPATVDGMKLFVALVDVTATSGVLPNVDTVFAVLVKLGDWVFSV